MSKDIFKVLEGWDHNPDEILVRVIQGDDGREKLQMRLDLGLLQMEMDGRPDGLRPEGFESWLDYFEHQQQAYEASNPDSAPYQLGEDDCIQLWREGIQFYHRYLSFWNLDRYDLCARDTARNLRLFAFVRSHVDDDHQKLQFDQWRPYVTMMNARAVAKPMIAAEQYAEALRVIEGGIENIREFLDQYDQSHNSEECSELGALEKWREEVLLKKSEAADALPQTPVDDLCRKLEEAVARESFEEAARLRDEIRRLSEPS